MSKSLHASIPAIDEILRLDATTVLIKKYGRPLVTEGVRTVIENIRSEISKLEEGKSLTTYRKFSNSFVNNSIFRGNKKTSIV